MNNEDKKFLIKWMGWDYICVASSDVKVRDRVSSEYWAINDKDNEMLYFFDEWKPDENHKQFSKIWEKLSGVHVDRVMKYFGIWHTPVSAINLFLNDLPRVMNVILEVLYNEN